MFVLWSIQIFWMWPPKKKEPLGPFISLVCAYIKCWWCFVVQSPSCVWLCDPMDCSKPDFPVLYCLPECAQISRPLSQWYYLTISSSATLFSFCLQSCPASGVFPMSWLFTSGGQALSLLYGPALTSVHDYWKNHSFDYTNFCLAILTLRIWLQVTPTCTQEERRMKICGEQHLII